MGEMIYSWRTIDPEVKQSWGEGRWVDEADLVIWTDDLTGLPCLAWRSPNAGVLCGYVGVLPGHPLHGVDRAEGDEIRVAVLIVHGEVSFTDHTDSFQTTLPPAAYQQLPPDAWWFGFHCGYEGTDDFAPGRRLPGISETPDYTYKDLNFVKGQCTLLADQLAVYGQLGLEAGLKEIFKKHKNDDAQQGSDQQQPQQSLD